MIEFLEDVLVFVLLPTVGVFVVSIIVFIIVNIVL
jgi:hypothetical protein